MDRGLTIYPPAMTPRSQLLASPPQAVPSLEELLSLEAELKSIQSKTGTRLKKTLTDMIAIKNIYKNAKQKDGKSKAKKGGGVKFPRDFSSTPDPEGSPAPDSAWAPGTSSRAVSAAVKEPSAFPSLPRTAGGRHDKKKKRKRDAFESDMESIEPDSQTRSRTSTNMSPPPVIVAKQKEHKEHHKDKKKKPNADDDGPHVRLNAAGYRVAENFNLLNRPVAPTRPLHVPPPPPGVTDPGQVVEDFSTRRQPSNQVPINQYWNYVEPLIRPLREEDIAFLEFNGDDVEPFLIPALGKHYLDLWEEEDALLEASHSRGDASSRGESIPLTNPYSNSTPNNTNSTFASSTNGALSSSKSKSTPSSATNWNPSTLTEADCITDERSYGPLTERLMGAFLMDDSVSGKLSELGEGPASGHGGGLGGSGKNGALAGTIGGLRVGDLEDRVVSEMTSLGLLSEGQLPDYSQTQDDEIVSELRRMQRLLMGQSKINSARKVRLSTISQSRLQYSDYMEYRDGLGRKLSGAFTKLSRVGVGRVGKNRKKKGDREREREMLKGIEEARVWSEAKYGPGAPHEPPVPPVSGSAGPMGIPGTGIVGVSGNLEVPDEVVEDMKLRKEWVTVVGGMMEELEQANPGRVRGTPQESIYKGIEVEAGVELSTSTAAAAADGTVMMQIDGSTPEPSHDGGSMPPSIEVTHS